MLKSILAGEGMGRALMNETVRRLVRLGPVTLDVGCKGSPSYHYSLDTSQTESFVRLDIEADPTVEVAGSVVRLPFRDECVDTVICLNVLEHVVDHSAALAEMRRILRSNGVLYLRVPFLLGVHGDPSDYWRFTRDALDHSVRAAGFDRVQIETSGGLFSAIYNLLDPVWRRIGVLRIVSAMSTLALDSMLSRQIGDAYRERYPLGYFVTASIQDELHT